MTTFTDFTDFTKFDADLRKGKVAGIIMWRGLSAIDGTPIVVVATKFDAASKNDKTGEMVQTYILPDPHAAGIVVNGSTPAKINDWLRSTGAVSICGDCPHAWQQVEGSSPAHYEKGACYVLEYKAPAAVLGAIFRASYPEAGGDFPAEWIPMLAAGLAVRLGSYGDPAAADPQPLIDLVSRAKTRTGYTHMWKSKYPLARANAEALRPYVMASCDSMEDYAEATRLRYRAFLITPKGRDYSSRSLLSVGAHIVGAMICPASEPFLALTGRKTTCENCGSCSGTEGKGANHPNVFIPAHGKTASRFAA
jgi:hypothetical protein